MLIAEMTVDWTLRVGDLIALGGFAAVAVAAWVKLGTLGDNFREFAKRFEDHEKSDSRWQQEVVRLMEREQVRRENSQVQAVHAPAGGFKT